MKNLMLAVCILSAIVVCGCRSVKVVDQNNDTGRATSGLDYRDFNNAAQKMIDSLENSALLNKPDGSRYVVAIGRIKNDTCQYIDVDQLMKKIRIQLLNSGKAIITTAVSAGGAEDEMSKRVRTLKDDPDFQQDTVIGQGTMIAPELSLSGKIIERQVHITKKDIQFEYYFQLTLTDLHTGLAIWEEEEQIIKRYE